MITVPNDRLIAEPSSCRARGEASRISAVIVVMIMGRNRSKQPDKSHLASLCRCARLQVRNRPSYGVLFYDTEKQDQCHKADQCNSCPATNVAMVSGTGFEKPGLHADKRARRAGPHRLPPARLQRDGEEAARAPTFYSAACWCGRPCDGSATPGGASSRRCFLAAAKRLIRSNRR